MRKWLFSFVVLASSAEIYTFGRVLVHTNETFPQGPFAETTKQRKFSVFLNFHYFEFPCFGVGAFLMLLENVGGGERAISKTNKEESKAEISF